LKAQAEFTIPEILRRQETTNLDRITLLIELVGVVILLMWIVIPIQEFRAILKKIRSRDDDTDVAAAAAAAREGAPGRERRP
jgi:hypothetical protein